MAKTPKTELAKRLTPSEREDQRKQIDIVSNWIGGYFPAGVALRRIQDKRLYEEKTFEIFCRNEWGYGKTQAWNVIKSASVVDVIKTIPGLPLPDNEAQARELSKIDDSNKMADIWGKVIKDAPKNKDNEPMITAKLVASVRDNTLNQPKPDPKRDGLLKSVTAAVREDVEDATDTELTSLAELKPGEQKEIVDLVDEGEAESVEEAIEIYTAPELTTEEKMIAESKEIESFCRGLNAMLKDLPDSPWFDENRKIIIQSEMRALCASIRHAKGHALCPRCSGEECKACRKTGWVNKKDYEALGGK